MEQVILKFDAGAAPYIAGDVAGFSPEDAAIFVKARVAHPLQPGEIAALRRQKAAAAAAASDDIVIVRFLTGHPPYRAGEIATFSEARALELVNAKVAEEIDESEVPEPLPHELPQPLERHKDGGAYIAPVDPSLVALVFVRSAHGYMAGERAGFDADTAEELVKSGAALDPKAEAAKEAAARRAASEAAETQRREQLDRERLEAEAKAAADKARENAGKEPDASKVDPNAEVLGLDDRKPEWREDQAKQAADQPPSGKALEGPPADKMVQGQGSSKKGRG